MTILFCSYCILLLSSELNMKCASKTSTRGWKLGTRKLKNAKRVALMLDQKVAIIQYYDESKKNVEKKINPYQRLRIGRKKSSVANHPALRR